MAPRMRTFDDRNLERRASLILSCSFNISMDPNVDIAETSTCTTCRFKEDKSNYWTAVMYFKHPNGSFIRVPQAANGGTGRPNGGMTIYYIQPPGNLPVTAFRKGFRMITGNPMIRNYDHVRADSPEAYALTYRCWDDVPFSDWAYAPGVGPFESIHLPKKKCLGGIRANIFFPSCWDGVNLDSPDHHSHVAFLRAKVPPQGIFYLSGECPETHPVRIPLLFMETVWDTRAFNHLWEEDGSGNQPFVLSMGDPTGYGHHGDYVFGWEGDSLQRAMDHCLDRGDFPDDCKELTTISDDEMNQCVQEPVVDEVTEGYLASLPGCNPIQEGPGPATLVPNCDAVSTTGFARPTPN
ncbi:hypothetical protein CC1G_12254 [Coprinopsis cinerea okayama7|uniref:DUF1996 domain-containing protein n=1 Tax=Coprinopsis cinerea (strain Okayama-7 / 130 / ATCC MYA-4618 / FGSC 9003) TaxID=240176 RepID=A8P772_COPC7|nr:hypothetical protein CC1G_12254 [Coprinopsis cinerea okayama7\|eukprot:XP_001839306.2 hypothetical protein CC1G_12254 [Coprinopsis cinerea okayama7\